MRTYYALAMAVLAFNVQAQHQISTTPNNTFSPAEIAIEIGETVTFNVGNGHTATQVSEETWLANGSGQLPGGFHYTTGTHEYVPTGDGIIYFVCQPHSSMGMKGLITVETGMSITDLAGTAVPVRIHPNPASNEFTISGNFDNAVLVLVDVQGREVLRRNVSTAQRVDVSEVNEGNYTAVIRKRNGSAIATQRITITR